MQCVNLQPDGSLQLVSLQSDGTCSGYVLLDSVDYGLMVQAVSITPEQVAQVFGWGFSVVLLFWSIGYGIGVAKAVISKL